MDVKYRSSNNKLYESEVAMQVIGSIYTRPSLLDEDGKYFFSEQDFVTEFHRVAFGVIYNLHMMGSRKVTSVEIDSYLKDRPQDRGIYESSGGFIKIAEIAEKCNLESFDYYYQRLKKMSLLRGYDAIGMDVSFLYDPDNLLDPQKRKEQEDKFDKYTLNDIAQIIEDKIEVVKRNRIDNATDEAEQIGDNIFQLLEDLEKTPEVGAPLYGKYINGITRGARLGKFYIRSAPTGVGNLPLNKVTY